MKEWSGMDFASSTRATENRTKRKRGFAKYRTKRKGGFAKSSVVLQRPCRVMG